MSTERRGLARAVSRDSISFVGGWYLIIYQAQFAATFNLSVFIGGMVIAGVPGILAAWKLAQPELQRPITPSSSGSPSEAASPPSVSP